MLRTVVFFDILHPAFAVGEPTTAHDNVPYTLCVSEIPNHFKRKISLQILSGVSKDFLSFLLPSLGTAQRYYHGSASWMYDCRVITAYL